MLTVLGSAPPSRPNTHRSQSRPHATRHDQVDCTRTSAPCHLLAVAHSPKPADPHAPPPLRQPPAPSRHCSSALRIATSLCFRCQSHGDAIGMPRPPPFLDPTLDANMIMEKGANYASGGGGILNETGRHFIQRFCFDKQIELFKGTQDIITRKIGKDKSNEFFQNALYFVAFGNNDFINNYLMPVYSDHWMFNDENFIKYLVHTYERQFKTLHNLGARKVFVFGLGPVGCIPMQRVMTDAGDCQESTNSLARNFNHATAKMINNLSKTLPNATFKFGDTYDFLYDLVTNPSKYGFTNSDSPCCSFGQIRPAFTCTPASILCQDRTKYIFWDEFHPTDSASELIAKEFLKKFGFSKANQDGDDPKSRAPAMAPAANGTEARN